LSQHRRPVPGKRNLWRWHFLIDRDVTMATQERQHSWFKGSFRDAWQTAFAPSMLRSGPIAGHVLIQMLINTAVAGFIAGASSALGPDRFWEGFLQILPFSQAIGFSIAALNVAGERILGAERVACMNPLWRSVYWAVISFAGLYAGFAGTLLVTRGGSLQSWLNQTNDWFAASTGMAILILVIIGLQARSHMKALHARADAEAQLARALATEKQLAEARLRLLQAQIEPHFLFNTLANVHGLIEPQPEVARVMLGHFIYYLRASLHVTRQTETTLAGEVLMLTSYLALFEVRFGERLQVSIDVPGELQSALLAPMLIQPLVENAIKHGIEPAIDGGKISLCARREGQTLVIEVRDTGLGFRCDAPAGVGLANVRDRLRALYGSESELDIREGDGPPEARGTIASVRLPFRGTP
jgi:signal transduction histidine kinase